MWALIIFLVAGTLILMLTTYFQRKNKNEEINIVDHIDEECCGAHDVCDKDSLLSGGEDIIYYDDEELDALACMPADKYTDEQIQIFSDVFFTLRESDVAGWLRSLQMRRIELPAEIREQALFIVSERRQHPNG